MRTLAPRARGIVATALVSILAGGLPARSNAKAMAFTLMLPARDVRVESAGEFSSLRIDRGAENVQYVVLTDPGAPALPYRIVRVLLPEGVTVADYEAHFSEPVVISQAFHPRLVAAPGEAPAQPSPPLWIPGENIRYLGTGYWHGNAIASFAVFPFQIEGDRLSLHETIELSLVTGPQVVAIDVARPERLSPGAAEEIRSRIASLVVNPRELVRYRIATAPIRGRFEPTPAPSLEGSPVEYLIVTSESLVDAYQRLADWKTSKGVPTVVRSVEWIEANHRRGVDTQETLRLFIRDAYEKWGVKWVLLGGDTPEIPARFAYSTYYYGGKYVVTDLYFAGLDGSWNEDHDERWGEIIAEGAPDYPDLYAEIGMGRLPTSTPLEVAIITDKIIEYEKGTDRTYTNKALFLAEVLYPYPWSPGQEIQKDGAWNSEFVIASNPAIDSMVVVRSYEAYDLYPGAIPESRQRALDSLEAGYNMVFHIGHGFRFNLHVADDNITITDADALTNAHRWFNLYMLNCSAAAFDYECLAERFLVNPSGGAVSVVGADDGAFPDAATYYLNEYVRAIFGLNRVHIADAFNTSRLPRTPVALASDGPDLWTHYVYTILSDPELPLWSGTVDTLAVTHIDTVGVGIHAIEVGVSASGSPAESVLVCLWKETDDYQYAFTDPAGLVSFDFACETPGSLSVFASKRNHAPYIGEIAVTPEAGPYVNLASTVVVDDPNGATSGNGDGVVDAGEVIELYPILRNTGGTASGTVQVTLTSADPSVSILDALAGVDSIAADSSRTASDPWRMSFSSSIADEHAVHFSIAIEETSAGGSLWFDAFARTVHAPNLEFVTLRPDDSPPVGDGDGTITSGEEFLLFVGVKNYGTGAAHGLNASIRDLDGGLILVDSLDVYADVLPLVELENTDGFRLSEISTAIENALEVTVTDAFGRSLVDTVEFRAPLPPTAIDFDASLGADRIQLVWVASSSPDANRYRVLRSRFSGGPYTIANTDLLQHTVYIDTGLDPSTRYYYVLQTIDESGNLSAFSSQASVSTNPPQLSGWPNVMPDVSANSPVAGDLDGDGDLELVVGNDFLYVWHHDGKEYRDGDENQQTWGVFSDLGSDFIGPIAMAKLDSNPGREIAAASYTTKEVYCFGRDGSPLPGWPRPTLYNVRAGIAVGDVDGDDDIEIIAVDQKAVMYAWHADGSEVIDGDANPATSGVFRRFPTRPWVHYQSPAVCDIDMDGSDEIIIGTQDSTVYAVEGNGENMPGWPVRLIDFAGGGIAVGDLDGNGDLEIVIPVKNAGRLLALNHDGSQMWLRGYFAQNLFFNPSPALADFNGDGKLEIVLPTSQGMVYVFNYLGNTLPGWPVYYSHTTYTESSPVIADVSGDGVPDIILGDESRFINAWDISGAPVDGFPLATSDALRGTPLVTDLDLDGDVDVSVAGYDRIVYVWDFSVPFDAAPWPEFHANSYHNCLHGFEVPTGISDVLYSVTVGSDAVEITWSLPEEAREAGPAFGIDRAVSEDETPLVFERIAVRELSPAGTVTVRDEGVNAGTRYVYRLEALDGSGLSVLTGEVYVPVTRAGLERNFPNPFNPTTTLVFYVPEGPAAEVTLEIFDVTGARVRVLASEILPAGRHTQRWDGRDDRGNGVGSGVYFCRLSMPGFTQTRKMTLLK